MSRQGAKQIEATPGSGLMKAQYLKKSHIYFDATGTKSEPNALLRLLSRNMWTEKGKEQSLCYKVNVSEVEAIALKMKVLSRGTYCPVTNLITSCAPQPPMNAATV